MDIGKEGEPYIAEPIEDPFRPARPVPQRRETPLPKPERTPTPERVRETGPA
jgi:hypothetical protein